MTQAEQLRDNPTQEVREFAAHAVELSDTSESTVRRDFVCDDDSVLVVTSHAGGDVQYAIEQVPPDIVGGEVQSDGR